MLHTFFCFSLFVAFMVARVLGLSVTNVTAPSPPAPKWCRRLRVHAQIAGATRTLSLGRRMTQESMGRMASSTAGRARMCGETHSSMS